MTSLNTPTTAGDVGPAAPASSTPAELVLLVHGLAAPPAVLFPLSRWLRLRGYETVNWGYRSVRGEIESLSETLENQMRRCDERPESTRFHLVTHSMGSILARVVLARNSFSRLGRVVMLAPPHAGSRVAALLAPALGRLCRPLTQLSDAPGSFVHRLPTPAGYEIGIIAAARDRVVRVESTVLTGQADHLVVNSGHTTMLFRRDVAEMVERFLRSGRFVEQALRREA